MPRPLPVLVLAAMLLATEAPAADRAACIPRSACKAECSKTNAEIRRIQARMRQGYGAADGAKLEGKLRELRRRRSKVCP